MEIAPGTDAVTPRAAAPITPSVNRLSKVKAGAMVQDHWPVGSEPQFVTTLGYSWTQRHGGDSDVGRGWRRCPNRYGSGARAFWSTDTSLSVARWVGDGEHGGQLAVGRLRAQDYAAHDRWLVNLQDGRRACGAGT